MSEQLTPTEIARGYFDAIGIVTGAQFDWRAQELGAFASAPTLEECLAWLSRHPKVRAKLGRVCSYLQSRLDDAVVEVVL